MIDVPSGQKDLYVAAALADMIYARDPNDQAISLDDIGLQLGGSRSFLNRDDVATAVGAAAQAFQGLFGDGVVQSTNEFFYSDTGFVGAIVKEGDRYIVVFRGSDTGSTTNSGDIQDALLDGDSAGGKIDGPDWHQNVLMGRGYLEGRTQAEDAIALTEAAIALAGGDKSKVSVAGQSLGGGLAGVVSAVLDVDGIGIAPAPFGYQLMAFAFREVGHANNIPEDFINEAFALWRAWNPIPGIAYAEEEYMTSEVRDARIEALDADLLPFDTSYIEFAADAGFHKLQYDANLSQHFDVHRIDGEILSHVTDHWYLELLGFGDYFQGKDLTEYEFGEAEGATLHGPSPHLLAITTSGSTQDFSVLMNAEDVLRASLFDIEGISGAIDHNRADVITGGVGESSKVTGGGPNPTSMMRALWKSKPVCRRWKRQALWQRG